jgi:hypothetical protein
MGYWRGKLDLGHIQKLGVKKLLFQCGLKPIGLRKTRRIGLEIEVRPVRKRAAQFRAGPGDALLAVDRRVAAGEHHLGLPIKGAGVRAVFQTPGPTARMSQTVRTKSILRRSSVCARLAKVVMVVLSVRSRRCAVSDMTKWVSTSHATVSVSASLRPRRGQSARATSTPALE